MATKATDPQMNYRNLSDELDSILESLQSDELDIDHATDAYQRGMTIVKQLEQYLQNAENKIVKLKRKFGELEP